MSTWDTEDKNEYPLQPEGKVTAEVFDVKPGDKDGTPTLSVQYKLASNKRMWQNFSFNEKGRKFCKWQMSELGLNDTAKALRKSESWEDIRNSYVDAFKEVLGKEVTLKISHKEWNGKKYESVLVSMAAPVGLAGDQNKAPSFDSDDRIPF